jgi:hypothetical protein
MSRLKRLLNLLKAPAGNQRGRPEAIATLRGDIGQGGDIRVHEMPKTEEVRPGPGTIPAPVNNGGVPESLKGLSYSEIALLAEDGELSELEFDWFSGLQGPSDGLGRPKLNLKYYMRKGVKNG